MLGARRTAGQDRWSTRVVPKVPLAGVRRRVR